MSIPATRIKEAVDSGVSFVCATCSRHWRSVLCGGTSCGQLQCGGPMTGRTYPLYDGPLPSGHWASFCCVTGSPHDLVALKVVGNERMLAVTRDRKGMFEDYVSVSGAIDCTEDRRILFIESRVQDATRPTE